MFFNKYPYSDFHELNIDWLLKHVHEQDAKIKNLNNVVEALANGEEIDKYITVNGGSGTDIAQLWGTYVLDNPANDGLVYTVQGCCTDGNFWWYALLNEANEKVLIIKMTMLGVEVSRNIITGILGHCNGMSLGLSSDTIVCVDGSTITELDSGDLTVKAIHTIDSASNYCIATNFEDQVYYVYNGNYIRTYSPSFTLVKQQYFPVLANADAGAIKQGCAYNPEDGRLYLLYSNPSCSYAVNLEDVSDVVVRMIDSEFWHCGELEDGSFVDGNLYFTSAWGNTSGNMHIRFWYVNFYKGVKPVIPWVPYISGVSLSNLVVDSDVNDFRPLGTSDHPFYRIGDAIEFSNEYTRRFPGWDVIINCRGESSLGRILIRNQGSGLLININLVPHDIIFCGNCGGSISFRNINLVSNVNNNPYVMYFIRCSNVTVDKGKLDTSVAYTSDHRTMCSESNAYMYDICTPEEWENAGGYISTSLALAPILIYRGILQTNSILKDHCTYTNGMGVFNSGIGLHNGFISVE